MSFGINLPIYKIAGPLTDYMVTERDLKIGFELKFDEEKRDFDKDIWIEEDSFKQAPEEIKSDEHREKEIKQ